MNFTLFRKHYSSLLLALAKMLLQYFPVSFIGAVFPSTIDISSSYFTACAQGFRLASQVGCFAFGELDVCDGLFPRVFPCTEFLCFPWFDVGSPEQSSTVSELHDSFRGEAIMLPPIYGILTTVVSSPDIIL